MTTPDQSSIVWNHGKLVILRPVTTTDLPWFQTWINDPANRRYLNVTQPMGEVGENTWGERAMSGDPNHIALAICLPDGSLIGNIGMAIDPSHQSAVTGTLIGPHDQKGNGYATDAKMLLLDYAFNWRNVRKVTSKILAINEHSQRYAARCGYRKMACIEQEHFRDGQWIDELQFVVFADEWRPLWEVYRQTIPRRMVS